MRLTIFIFSLVWIVALVHAKCIPDDPDCAKQGASLSYPLFIGGIEGSVQSSDPLTLDVILGNLPDIKYKLQNVKFRGMKTCNIAKLEVNRKEFTFKYHLECPTIHLNADYELFGKVADIPVEGEGEVNVYCKDYVFMFDGKFEKIKGKDGKDHAQIKYFLLDANPRESEVFDFENLYNGNKEKSAVFHKYINDNWKVVDEKLRPPVINPVMDLFIKNLNDFLKIVPIDEVFPG
ncbi:circadian clock-controlled protein daywake-like [Anticarsia gemmatalis]|uniref:circadian clock-controlled protein daywake-like n=1 Tax=Anticarsia gemmatalis TaxID=129554 RepID=UPI003F7594C9